MEIERHTALVVVDVQRDFCPGGALPVPEGDRVVSILNQYIERFSRAGAPIFFTRDWHPKDHMSFKEQGGIWPPHCVQGTDGAKFHPDIRISAGTDIVSKAERKDKEAYSGFQETELAEKLRQRGIKRVLVGGLATDYCVKRTVLDGLEEGFEVFYLDDASRGVEVKPGDSERAVKEMVAMGAKRLTLRELLLPATQSQ